MGRHTILLFIDGLGWGTAGLAENPLAKYGGRMLCLPAADSDQPIPLAAQGWGRPVDAVLGVPGLPQSATGQTTLLTGINSQAALGLHLSGFPNLALREILLAHSILKSLTDSGLKAAFLNAFRPRFWELSRARQLTLSATTVANLAADLPFFGLDDIHAGHSIYQEMTNAELIKREFPVDPLSPAEAGRIAARSSTEYDFLLYEYFQTDRAGHTGQMDQAVVELQRLDEFLVSLLAELGPDQQTLVLLTSDHGNIEDLRTRHHTANPVPLLAWGDGAREFVSGVTRLDQITPRILARHDAQATARSIQTHSLATALHE